MYSNSVNVYGEVDTLWKIWIIDYNGGEFDERRF